MVEGCAGACTGTYCAHLVRKVMILFCNPAFLRKEVSQELGLGFETRAAMEKDKMKQRFILEQFPEHGRLT